ncbi:GNAT family N-acetyltransferase [Novosphingobium sp. KACC 22771]|uniref:GNAT family N-acetyltransferase n=1 Tax=Novosphingobium sp. KACC 22771 TaxID=3025670 RepID=UPI00236558F7|nr:GNAT family N-acetyltransferase [Novosphingobium sp. KACC 22771]WDF72368.1 GNAT family N-acetyltransferase [Novosphingobium sp. KACC 22771]
MLIRDAGRDDLAAILAIYNHAVLHTTAVWNETPGTIEERHLWFDAKQQRGFPVLVAADGEAVLGFASYGDFRNFPGFSQSVEHSIYVAPHAHRRGIGRALLEVLITRAKGAGLHAMIGGIDASNAASIALHQAMGFAEVGRLPQVGHKFGRWLDLSFMQKLLSEGAPPTGKTA